MLFINLKKTPFFIIITSFIFILVSSAASAAPTTTFHDPTITHNVQGLHRFLEAPKSKDSKKKRTSLSFSPYYQTASGARDKHGVRVPEGDRLGNWNMMALFYGFDASPIEKRFDLRGAALAFPTESATVADVEVLDVTATKPPAITNAQSNYPNLFNAFQKIFDIDAAANVDAITRTGVKLATGFNIPTEAATAGLFSVPIKFEKIGLRSELALQISKEFSVIVQTGFADYKQAPTFIDKTNTTVGTLDAAIQLNLTTTTALQAIAQELDVNLNKFSNTGMEDTNIKLAFSRPHTFSDDDNNAVVTLSPWIALGAWLPSGKKKDQDKPFSLALGNDGFYGLSFEGALNFDFVDLITVGFGGGLSVFCKQNLHAQRVPSDLRQVGFFPWKIDLKKRLGTAWNFNISLQAQSFIENLSFYADYVFAKKEQDEIELTDDRSVPHLPYVLQTSFFRGAAAPTVDDFEPHIVPPLTVSPTTANASQPDVPRSSLFYPKKLEEESAWHAQTFNAGLRYTITKDLALGLGFTTYIHGFRVYRTTTVMGSLDFTF